MSDTQQLPSISPLERPRCNRCKNRMTLIREEPREGNHEKRMFGCSKCNFMETRIVDDPLKSGVIVPPTFGFGKSVRSRRTSP